MQQKKGWLCCFMHAGNILRKQIVLLFFPLLNRRKLKEIDKLKELKHMAG
jgi:hypothetical protein